MRFRFPRLPDDPDEANAAWMRRVRNLPPNERLHHIPMLHNYLPDENHDLRRCLRLAERRAADFSRENSELMNRVNELQDQLARSECEHQLKRGEFQVIISRLERRLPPSAFVRLECENNQLQCGNADLQDEYDDLSTRFREHMLGGLYFQDTAHLCESVSM